MGEEGVVYTKSYRATFIFYTHWSAAIDILQEAQIAQLDS
jgi:hypothetical protein